MENIPIAESITKPLISTTQNNIIELKFCKQCGDIYRVNSDKLLTAQYYRCDTCSNNLLYKLIKNSCQVM